MSQMLRKQIYIDRRQERLLKRKASELRVSESELIRDGIEKVLRGGMAVPKDIMAWEKEKKFIHALTKQGAVKGGRTWRREDIYDRKVSGRH
ncbi:MAG: hypothetical protein ACM30F_00045 [Nitrospirota bacterium]